MANPKTEKYCLECGRNPCTKYCPKQSYPKPEEAASAEQENNDNQTNVCVVRHVGGSVLGSEESNLIPLPITDDRNENPAYAAWADVVTDDLMPAAKEEAVGEVISDKIEASSPETRQGLDDVKD